jgi:hypothetical protein
MCIQRFYPDKKIVVIDDNSKKELIKSYKEYKNVLVIQSQFPGRGELLPYYYFYKHKFFENAVIIHDSVFFHKRINFDKIKVPVMPLWHFPSDTENIQNTLRIVGYLNNNYELMKNINLNSDNNLLNFNIKQWTGCFGVQSYINHAFLFRIMHKYKLSNLLNSIKSRPDRCCLERIMGLIFCMEVKYNRNRPRSLLGNIQTYSKWELSFDEYINTLKIKKKVALPIVKVWTGR